MLLWSSSVSTLLCKCDDITIIDDRQLWTTHAHLKQAREQEMFDKHILQVWKLEYYCIITLNVQHVIWIMYFKLQSELWQLYLESAQRSRCYIQWTTIENTDYILVPFSTEYTQQACATRNTWSFIV